MPTPTTYFNGLLQGGLCNTQTVDINRDKNKTSSFIQWVHSASLSFMAEVFRRFFSECTEAITTSLILLETILPEECTFIIGFSCTVWTKMRFLLAQ